MVELLPSSVVPRRGADGLFHLPIRVPDGAFGQRAAAPVEARGPLEATDVLKLFVVCPPPLPTPRPRLHGVSTFELLERPSRPALVCACASRARPYLITGRTCSQAGGLCSASAHTALVPLDVVKTRLQTEPGVYTGPLDCATRIIRAEGPAAFAQGIGATLVGCVCMRTCERCSQAPTVID